MAQKRINHNDLLPWFTQDHGQLPATYRRATKKFFDELSKKHQATSDKLQATSDKLQATSCHRDKPKKILTLKL
jgi:hypothetical protein